MSDGLRASVENSWRELGDIDRALDRGEITEHGWYAAVLAVVEPAYLGADNPQAQSGHSGNPARWRQARRLLVDALPGNCDVLDVGCANAHLMESLVDWAAEDGLVVEPYGVEISIPLADLARRRQPRWSHRIWTANVLDWQPPRQFDVVRTGLDYVPPPRRADLVAHLLEHVVATGGRLVVGVFNEESGRDILEREVRSWGYQIAGRASRAHRHPALSYKAFWIDAARR
ncbi:MAG: hypothetical protein H0X18_03160 [Geodermatophilaceae bacterium]|nr:hypothetical protein [Geodermatophilaceae bacterium]